MASRIAKLQEAMEQTNRFTYHQRNNLYLANCQATCWVSSVLVRQVFSVPINNRKVKSYLALRCQCLVKSDRTLYVIKGDREWELLLHQRNNALAKKGRDKARTKDTFREKVYNHRPSFHKSQPIVAYMVRFCYMVNKRTTKWTKHHYPVYDSSSQIN